MTVPACRRSIGCSRRRIPWMESRMKTFLFSSWMNLYVFSVKWGASCAEVAPPRKLHSTLGGTWVFMILKYWSRGCYGWWSTTQDLGHGILWIQPLSRWCVLDHFFICDRRESEGSVAVQGDASFISLIFVGHGIERVTFVSWIYSFSSCVLLRLKSTLLRGVSLDLGVCVAELWFCITEPRWVSYYTSISILLDLDHSSRLRSALSMSRWSPCLGVPVVTFKCCLDPSCSACCTCPVPWKWFFSTRSCPHLVFLCLICLRINVSSVKDICQDLCGFLCLTLQYKRWIHKKCVYNFVWMLRPWYVYLQVITPSEMFAEICVNALDWLCICTDNGSVRYIRSDLCEFFGLTPCLTDDGSVKAYKVGTWCG